VQKSGCLWMQPQRRYVVSLARHIVAYVVGLDGGGSGF
jgi:hypothetical protein